MPMTRPFRALLPLFLVAIAWAPLVGCDATGSNGSVSGLDASTTRSAKTKAVAASATPKTTTAKQQAALVKRVVGKIIHFRGRIVGKANVLKHDKYYLFHVKTRTGRIVSLRVGKKLDPAVRDQLTHGTIARFSANRSKLNHSVYFLRTVWISAAAQGAAIPDPTAQDDTSDVADDSVADDTCVDDQTADSDSDDDSVSDSDDSPDDSDVDPGDGSDATANADSDGDTPTAADQAACGVSTSSPVAAPVASPAAPAAAAACGTLPGGQTLAVGASLVSCKGAFTLTMQTDGNLVIYPAGGGAAIWSTVTGGHTDATGAYMQTDANLVIYGAGNSVIYASNSGGHTGSFNLIMQDDGNLVIYDSANTAIWASNTGGH